ncbi:hypothetical protein ScPMuIL_017285 [Solemya velum]
MDSDENSDDQVFISEDDVVEVIELGENIDISGEEVAHDLDDIDLGAEDTEDGEHGAVGGATAPLHDDADLIFSKHTDSVFTVDIDPKTNCLAVSGGQDDHALVWSTTTGDVLFECSGHKDSVAHVGFSHDGKYVATGDLSGVIRVWETETHAEVWTYECSDIEWLEWHPESHILVVGTVDGNFWMWRIPSGDCRTYQGHGSTITSGRIMPDGKRAVVGYDDGVVKVWELKSCKVLQKFADKHSHSSSVVSLDCHHDNNLVITGSVDVTANVLNTFTGKVLSTYNCCSKSHREGEEDSVEAVGFSHVQNFAATGTLAGELRIWDLSSETTRHMCKHAGGVVKLKWDATSPLVYTCSLDGNVALWDCRNGERVSQWCGHTDSVLDFSISRDGNTLVSVSEDKTARVFSLHVPDR